MRWLGWLPRFIDCDAGCLAISGVNGSMAAMRGTQMSQSLATDSVGGPTAVDLKETLADLRNSIEAAIGVLRTRET